MNSAKNLTLAIVLHWGKVETTSECIRALEKNNGIDILIINNTGSQIQNKYEEIVSTKNLGFGGGMNIGLKKAISRDYRYALVLNNDTLVDEDLAKQLTIQLQENKNIAAIAPTIVFQSEPEKIWFAGGRLDLRSATSPHHLQGMSVEKLPSKAKLSSVSFLTGCCVLFKVSALKDIGLFDTDYFLYYEDDDWSIRAIKAGWKLGYWSAPLVRHAISSGSSSDHLRRYYFHRNRFLFIRKNLSRRQKITAYSYALIGMFKYELLSLLMLDLEGVRNVNKIVKDIISRKTGQA